MAAIGGHSHRRRRLRGRIIFVLLILISVIIFFAGQANNRLLDGTKREAADAVSPVMTYLTMPLRGFENVVFDLSARSQAHQENKRLKLELNRLSDVEARSNALAIKLSRFETILNVDVSSGIPDRKIAARAVAENNGPFVRSTLINAGANKGIKKGYGVMTVDGLLGHVVRVGQNSSRVLRLEDLNSRVSVMTLRSQSRAILTGDNSSLPKLSFVTEGSDWAGGDVVITSGDDGVLPQGLPVGYVKADTVGDLRVHLYVNENHVDWVWVYPFDGIKAPEQDPVVPVPEEGQSDNQPVSAGSEIEPNNAAVIDPAIAVAVDEAPPQTPPITDPRTPQ